MVVISAPGRVRARVEPGQRDRHRRAVDRVERPDVEGERERDRTERERDDERADGVPEVANRELTGHGGSIAPKLSRGRERAP